jgi:hypothetical protein
MRLQTIAKQLPRGKLIPCLELARENDPTNSEMSYWLGVHLLQGDSSDESDLRWNEICRGVDTLKTATELNPTGELNISCKSKFLFFVPLTTNN